MIRLNPFVTEFVKKHEYLVDTDLDAFLTAACSELRNLSNIFNLLDCMRTVDIPFNGEIVADAFGYPDYDFSNTAQANFNALMQQLSKPINNINGINNYTPTEIRDRIKRDKFVHDIDLNHWNSNTAAAPYILTTEVEIINNTDIKTILRIVDATGKNYIIIRHPTTIGYFSKISGYVLNKHQYYRCSQSLVNQIERMFYL